MGYSISEVLALTKAHQDSTAETWCVLHIGVFAYSQFMGEAREYCWMHDIDLHTEEMGGLLEKRVGFRLKAKRAQDLVPLLEWMEKLTS